MTKKKKPLASWHPGRFRRGLPIPEKSKREAYRKQFDELCDENAEILPKEREMLWRVYLQL